MQFFAKTFVCVQTDFQAGGRSVRPGDGAFHFRRAGSRRITNFRWTMSLDISTLYLVATMVAAMLGAMLLLFGKQENIPALKWWGTAYLLGAASVALWTPAAGAPAGLPSLALRPAGVV